MDPDWATRRVVPPYRTGRNGAKARVVVRSKKHAWVGVPERLQQRPTVCGETVGVVLATETRAVHGAVAVVPRAGGRISDESRHFFVSSVGDIRTIVSRRFPGPFR